MVTAMKDNSYIYSTKDVSRYYDLTAKGLAYYEEQGLLKPLRTGTAGYRAYTLDDCYSLYHSKLYTNAGFALKKTAELLGSDDEEDILSSLNAKVEEERKLLVQKQFILDRLEQAVRLIRDYQKHGRTFSYAMRPDLYRLYVRNYEEQHTSTNEQSKEFAMWNQVIPADTASLKYDRDAVLSGKKQLDVNIGNVMRKEAFELFGFEVSPRVEVIEGCMCIGTILCGSSEGINSSEWLNPVLDYMDREGYRLCGDIITSLILVTGEKGNRTRYDYAWFPAEKI